MCSYTGIGSATENGSAELNSLLHFFGSLCLFPGALYPNVILLLVCGTVGLLL